MSEIIRSRRPILDLRGMSLIRAAGILAAAVFGVTAPIHAAETIAGLMSDGRVITAAIEEGETGFASKPETLAELDADGGEFIDVTAGKRGIKPLPLPGLLVTPVGREATG